jgi:hypothetical protein
VALLSPAAPACASRRPGALDPGRIGAIAAAAGGWCTGGGRLPSPEAPARALLVAAGASVLAALEAALSAAGLS